MAKSEISKINFETPVIDTIKNNAKKLDSAANTSELGTFKIKKEEASSAGVRRIKAVLE